MTTFHLYGACAVILVALAVHTLTTHRDLVRKVLALNVMGTGVFLLLVALAARGDAAGPPDPVPHALVLTGIVVAVSATGLALAVIRRVHALTGRSTLVEEEGLE